MQFFFEIGSLANDAEEAHRPRRAFRSMLTTSFQSQKGVRSTLPTSGVSVRSAMSARVRLMNGDGQTEAFVVFTRPSMELIDTHSHLTFEPLSADVPGVFERSRAAGVTGWITVGTSLEDSRKAIELAGQYESLYATVGIHPHDAQSADLRALEELKQLARREKVVAVGETGLDFHYNFSKQPDQMRVFEAHLDITREVGLPVVIHSRNAFDETMQILDRCGRGLKGVVFHCFSGSAEQARMVLERGYFVSFTGVVTFKNAEVTRQAAQVVPLDRLMIETDCPYMSPEPVRSRKPNEPALMVHTAEFLARLQGISLDELAQATTRAAVGFFGLAGISGA
jgi:TatD DNase family protein